MLREAFFAFAPQSDHEAVDGEERISGGVGGWGSAIDNEYRVWRYEGDEWRVVAKYEGGDVNTFTVYR